MLDGTTIPLTFVDVEQVGVVARIADEAERDQGGRAIGPESDTSLVQLSPTQVLVTWIGTNCERGYVLSADTATIRIVPAARPGCDAARFAFAAVLQYSETVDGGELKVEVGPRVIVDPDDDETDTPPPVTPDPGPYSN